MVEDEPAYLELLRKQLTARGYKVFGAKDGDEGLKIAFNKNPDLILLDLLLPGTDGLKMLSALRKFKWGKSMPVFVLTNTSELNILSEAMENRATKCFIKSDLKLKDLLEDIELFL